MVAEAAFRRAHVRTESVQADCIIANLDHHLIPNIKHLIELDPKPADIYTQIKTRLISSFPASAEARLRRLLRGEVISEGKPSLFLARLRALNGGSCTDNILRSVFLEQMPSQIRAILTMSNIDSLQELANLADKILEASQPMRQRAMPFTSAFRQKCQKLRQALLLEGTIYPGKLIAPRRSKTISEGSTQSHRH